MSPALLAALVGGVAVVFVVAALLFWPGNDADAAFQPVESIEYEQSPNHIHGIGYDSDSERLYLASHFGLFALGGDQLHQVGNERSDLMGFSMNPDDPSELFISGHPQGGGNLGLLHSTDQGLSFEQIFTGISDEIVDFHGMTISAADPDRFYGAFMGQIYRSTDRGSNFTAVRSENLSETGLCWGVPCLAAGSGEPDTVYAGTEEGLMVSDDGAENWQLLTDELGQVAAVTADPNNPDRLVAYTEAMGVAISEDRGQSWESRQGDMPSSAGGVVFAIALDQSESDHLFVATMNNEVFETVDGGETWERIV
ncbi:MAG: hypothetical protein WD401_03205 [Thermomicrobiaceae bacterium]